MSQLAPEIWKSQLNTSCPAAQVNRVTQRESLLNLLAAGQQAIAKIFQKWQKKKSDLTIDNRHSIHTFSKFKVAKDFYFIAKKVLDLSSFHFARGGSYLCGGINSVLEKIIKIPVEKKFYKPRKHSLCFGYFLF